MLCFAAATQVDYLSGLANQVQDMTGMLDMAAEDMDNYKWVTITGHRANLGHAGDNGAGGE
jgi:hypothetical protein